MDVEETYYKYKILKIQLMVQNVDNFTHQGIQSE